MGLLKTGRKAPGVGTVPFNKHSQELLGSRQSKSTKQQSCNLTDHWEGSHRAGKTPSAPCCKQEHHVQEAPSDPSMLPSLGPFPAGTEARSTRHTPGHVAKGNPKESTGNSQENTTCGECPQQLTPRSTESNRW